MSLDGDVSLMPSRMNKLPGSSSLVIRSPLLVQSPNPLPWWGKEKHFLWLLLLAGVLMDHHAHLPEEVAGQDSLSKAEKECLPWATPIARLGAGNSRPRSLSSVGRGYDSLSLCCSQFWEHFPFLLPPFRVLLYLYLSLVLKFIVVLRRQWQEMSLWHLLWTIGFHQHGNRLM